MKQELQKRSRASEIKKLSDELNKRYYDKGKPTQFGQEINIIQTAILDAMNDDVVARINTVASSQSPTKPVTQKSYIKKETLVDQANKLLKLIEMARQALNKKEIPKKDLSNALSVLQQMEKVAQGAKRLRNQAIKDLNVRKVPSINEDEKVISINKAEEYYNQMQIYIEALKVRDIAMTEVGAVLERSLADWGLGEEEIEKEATLEILNEFSDKIQSFTTGKIQIARGGANITATFKVPKGEKIKQTGKTIKKVDKGKYIEVTKEINTGSKKSMKMDVLLYPPYLEASQKAFRVSAKNFASGSDEIGHSDLLGIISRTGGEENTKLYAIGLLSNNSVNSALEYGKMAIAADIIAGYSQTLSGQEGYADVLVINTGTEIKVFDIATLITEASNKIRINGYEGVEKEATARYNEFRDELDPISGYLPMFMGDMASRTITVRLSYK